MTTDDEVYRLPPPSIYANTTVSPAEAEAARAERRRRTEAAIAERQKEDAEIARAREQRRVDEGRAALDAYEGKSRAAFTVAGGSPREWEAAWPELKRRYLIDQAQAGDPREHAVRQAMADLGQSSDGF